MFGKIKNALNRIKKSVAQRFSFGQLIGSAIALIVIGMILSVGTIFVTQMKNTDVVQNSTEATGILDKVLSALGVYGDWLTPLAFVIVGSLVIMILLAIYIKLRGVTAVTE